jgi:hypothetical protein
MSTRSEQGPFFDVPKKSRLNETAKDDVSHNFLPQIDIAADVLYRALWEQYSERFEAQFTRVQPQPVEANLGNVTIAATHQEQLNGVISSVGQGAMQQVSPYEQAPYDAVLTDLQDEMHNVRAATEDLVAGIQDEYRLLTQPPLEDING